MTDPLSIYEHLCADVNISPSSGFQSFLKNAETTLVLADCLRVCSFVASSLVPFFLS